MLMLLGQTAPIIQETTTTQNGHLLKLIFNADPLVQLSLLVLLIFSVVSWAIIIAKHRQLKNSERKSQRFFEQFWGAARLDEMNLKRSVRGGSAYQIFQTAQQSLENNKNPGRLEPFQRDVRRAFDEELEQMEYGVPFLATTASAAPFIGLFGTVWGILNAFWKIGQSGSSSLALVGPHIAEALIATAIGLAAAIPAVIFYNFFVNRIRRFSRDLQDFTEELIDRISHESFGAKQS